MIVRGGGGCEVSKRSRAYFIFIFSNDNDNTIKKEFQFEESVVLNGEMIRYDDQSLRKGHLGKLIRTGECMLLFCFISVIFFITGTESS